MVVRRKAQLEAVPVFKVKLPLIVCKLPEQFTVAVSVLFMVKWWNDCPKPESVPPTQPLTKQVLPLFHVMVGIDPPLRKCSYVPVEVTVTVPTNETSFSPLLAALFRNNPFTCTAAPVGMVNEVVPTAEYCNAPPLAMIQSLAAAPLAMVNPPEVMDNTPPLTMLISSAVTVLEMVTVVPLAIWIPALLLLVGATDAAIGAGLKKLGSVDTSHVVAKFQAAEVTER